jgi:hypothetical protein
MRYSGDSNRWNVCATRHIVGLRRPLNWLGISLKTWENFVNRDSNGKLAPFSNTYPRVYPLLTSYPQLGITGG